MDVAAEVFDEVSAGWGLTLSVPKAKLLVTGVGLYTDNVAPLQMSGGAVQVVNRFQYLGSLVEAAGGMRGQVEHHIVQASRTFGSLCNAVFMDHQLNFGDQEIGVLLSTVKCVVIRLVQKLGPPPRFWLKNWSGFIVVVYIVLWGWEDCTVGKTYNHSPIS